MAKSREFQDLVSAARSAKSAEEKLRADKSADAEALKLAEQAFLDADNKVRDAEEKALTADAKVAAGRQKADAAQAKLREMRDRMEEELQKDSGFASAVAALRARDTAVEATLTDQKNIDARIAAMPTTREQPKPLIDNPNALRDAGVKLDAINRDLENAAAEMAKLEARVNEDRDGLRYARRDRDALSAPAVDRGPVLVDQPVYSEEVSPVLVPAPYYPPIYDVPEWRYGNGVYLGLGYSYYDGGYGDRYYDRYRGRYYGRYYDRDEDRHDWHEGRDVVREREGRDISSDASRQRAARLREQAYTEHLEYRARKDIRDTQAQQDRQAYQQRKDQRSEQAAAERSASEARRQVRAEEDLHGRRAAEDASRSETRQARHASPPVEQAPQARQPVRSEPSPQVHEYARPAHNSSPAPDSSSHNQGSHSSNQSNQSNDPQQGAAHGHGR